MEKKTVLLLTKSVSTLLFRLMMYHGKGVDTENTKIAE